jgi:hypothetical protein
MSFTFYYTIFGANGAIANGKRGKKLAICFISRILSMHEDWNMPVAFDHYIAKTKDPVRRKQMLTKEECVNLLPENLKTWKSPI